MSWSSIHHKQKVHLVIGFSGKKHIDRINHEMNDKPNCVPNATYSCIYNLYRLDDDSYMRMTDV